MDDRTELTRIRELLERIHGRAWWILIWLFLIYLSTCTPHIH